MRFHLVCLLVCARENGILLHSAFVDSIPPLPLVNREEQNEIKMVQREVGRLADPLEGLPTGKQAEGSVNRGESSATGAPLL